jgi:hypothetical protein
MFIEAPFVLSHWLKNPPELAITFCQLQLVRNLIEQLFLPLNSAIGASGRIKGFQIVSSIIYIILLPISYLLFKIGSNPVVIYMVFIGGSTLLLLNTLYFSVIFTGLKIINYWNGVIRPCTIPLMVVTLFALSPTFFMSASTFRLLVVIVISTTTWLWMVFKEGLNPGEKESIMTMIRGLLMRFQITVPFLK